MQSGSHSQLKTFTSIKADSSWSFEGLTRKDTNYLTHSYHRYPAKFIPQLARRLVQENSQKGEWICDPFFGSGSAIVEALMQERRACGSDINPLACLITKAKTTPLNRIALREEISSVMSDLDKMPNPLGDDCYGVVPEEVLGWFEETTPPQLAYILNRIEKVEDQSIQLFFVCAFSHILKGCSYWSNESVKPYRQPDKFLNRPTDPVGRFRKHLLMMERRNNELIGSLPQRVALRIDEYRNVQIADARCLDAPRESISLVVTSPPYMVSYEYREIHGLSLKILKNFFGEIPRRDNFIGSISRKSARVYLRSRTANIIVEELEAKNPGLAMSINSYFLDMQECFLRMRELLRSGGRIAVVIGDTSLRGVPILNAEVFSEILSDEEFHQIRVVKREIPFKSLPTLRDPRSGRFVKVGSSTRISMAYPHEYILLFEKP